MRTGLRRILSLWTTILIAGVVAASLDTSRPVGRWMAVWRGGGSRLHVGTALLVLVVGWFLFLPLIQGAMRGRGQEEMRQLPLGNRMRFAADLASVALFDAVPAVVCALFVIVAAATRGRAFHDGAMAMVVFAGLAILQTAGLDERRRRDRVLIWFLVVVCAVVAFARNVEPFAGAMAALFLLVTAFDAAASSEMVWVDAPARAAARRPRWRPSGGGLALNEMRALWRGGGSGLLYAMAWGSALVGAGWLAGRNNGATSPAALGRIGALFGALAVCVVTVEVARARRAMLPFRELEALLPISLPRRLLLAGGAASIWIAIVPLATLALWRGDAVHLLPVLAAELLLTILSLASAESELLIGRSVEVPVIAWGAAAAIAGALAPFITAMALAVGAAVSLWLLVRRSLESDVLRPEDA